MTNVRGMGEVTSARTPDGSTRTLFARHLPSVSLADDRICLALLTQRPDQLTEQIELYDVFEWPFRPDITDEYEPPPASADQAAAFAQLERFREAVAVCLSSADPPDFGIALGELFHAIPLPRLLFEALREGPPPAHPPMSGTLGDHARSSARSLRRIEGEELDELRWRYGRGRRPDIEEASAQLRARFNRGRPARRPPRRPPPADIVAAFAVAGWTLLFSLNLGQCEGFFEDSVYFVRDQRAHLVLVTDPWDPAYPFSVDGDDATWRLVATWFAHALRDHGLDVPLRKVDDEDDEDDVDEQPLSDWVLGKAHAPRIVLDWRLAGRILKVVPYTEWTLNVLSDDERGPEASAAREAYHAFVRDVIDPGFASPPGPLSDSAERGRREKT